VLNPYRDIYVASNLSVHNRKDIVKPALHGGYFLAPTTGQRLRYQSYLSVYGKDKVQVSENMAAMIKESHVSHLLV